MPALAVGGKKSFGPMAIVMRDAAQNGTRPTS